MFLHTAINKIEEHKDISLVSVSSFYEAKPLGNIEQGNFLNAVIFINTQLNPIELFSFVKNIEKELGRLVTYKWGPRVIDLDILLFDDIVYKDEQLTIPHPGLLDRDFVLVPLAELNPDLIHPLTKEKLSRVNLDETKKVIIKKCSQNKNKEVEYFE